MNMERQGFNEGNGLEIDIDFVLANPETITDFFGDHRECYEKLKKGGTLYLRTSLDSQEEWEADGEDDLPPLDPSKATNEQRAKNIAGFFREHEDIKKLFLASIKETQV